MRFQSALVCMILCLFSLVAGNILQTGKYFPSGVNLHANTSSVPCNEGEEGSVLFESSLQQLVVCQAGTWKQVSSNATLDVNELRVENAQLQQTVTDLQARVEELEGIVLNMTVLNSFIHCNGRGLFEEGNSETPCTCYDDDVRGHYAGTLCASCMPKWFRNDRALCVLHDEDLDGVYDDDDNCPDTVNSDQSDVDSDGIGDVCDSCIYEANSGQEDSDGDHVGDACDACPSIPYESFIGGVCRYSPSCQSVVDCFLESNSFKTSHIFEDGDYVIDADGRDPTPESVRCILDGGWNAVVELDTTNDLCPSGWASDTALGRTICRRFTGPGCASASFEVPITAYQEVTGRILAYQYATMDAFLGSEFSIDATYLDGVSLTSGNQTGQRDHVYSLAVGLGTGIEGSGHDVNNCPCDVRGAGNTARIPGFVGGNWYCETGSDVQAPCCPDQWFSDPLFDSQGCDAGSTCCARGGPYFSTDLGSIRQKPIEVRLCSDQDIANEDIGVYVMDIYARMSAPGADADSDGIPDACDLCPNTFSYANMTDTDLDWIGDECDACPNDADNDADNDGVCGDVDICPGGDDNIDSDSDGIPDFCDSCPFDADNDIDSDTFCGDVDNCPFVSNVNQLDGDGDGIGNVCDNCEAISNPSQADADSDSIGDACDNCILAANVDQADTDGDFLGDACDPCPSVSMGVNNSATNQCELPTSCMNIYSCFISAHSAETHYQYTDGQFSISVSGTPTVAECDFSNGGYTRIINFDRAVDSCPSGWQSANVGVRNVCKRPTGPGCFGHSVATMGIEYQYVRGRARAHHFGSMDAFTSNTRTIDEPYVDGISITSGDSTGTREHVYSFATGLGLGIQGSGHDVNQCECSSRGPSNSARRPSFVGNNWFCETSSYANVACCPSEWYTSDPLFDSQGCPSGTCCQRGGPWFEHNLGSGRTKPLEIRLCSDQDTANEDIGIYEAELFVREAGPTQCSA